LIRAGRDGAAGHFHPRCWTEERTKGPFRRRKCLPIADPGSGRRAIHSTTCNSNQRRGEDGRTRCRLRGDWQPRSPLAR
jgi:hypothetical protein